MESMEDNPPFSSFLTWTCKRRQLLLEKISREEMPLDDSMVSLKVKRRQVCLQKILKVQCSRLRNFKEFKRKM